MSVSNFSSFSDTPIAPARHQRLVTPSNDADLPDGICKALEVTAAGDVTCIAADDSDEQAVTRSGYQAGTIIPIRARRVLATGTTATVVALY